MGRLAELTNSTMPRDAEPSLSERTFVTKTLTEGLRVDNRKFDQCRPVLLTFGDEFGVADVSFGKARVLARTSAEVTVPYADRPFDGVFTITSELSPMVAPSIEPNRPTETEVLLSRLLEKTVRRSGALDTESLCLVAGQKCWSVRVDLHVLNHDGNILDAACLAVIASLRHFKRPETTLDGEVLTVYTPAEREPVPLSWLEEQLRVSSCTFSLNRHGEICQVSKLGGSAVDAPLLIQCAQTALSKSKEYTDLLERKLAEDAKSRDKGGLMAELTAENDR